LHWSSIIWRTGVMGTCITFCLWPDSYLTLLWMVQYHLKYGSYVYLYYILLVTRQLFNTTLNGQVSFEIRELCVLVLHSAWPDSYLKLLWLVRCIFRTRDMCTCITFCWTRQLFNTTLIGPWHLEDGRYMYLYYILLDQTVI